MRFEPLLSIVGVGSQDFGGHSRLGLTNIFMTSRLALCILALILILPSNYVRMVIGIYSRTVRHAQIPTLGVGVVEMRHSL